MLKYRLIDRWGSSLPGLRKLDPPLSHPSTQAKFCWRTCLIGGGQQNLKSFLINFLSTFCLKNQTDHSARRAASCRLETGFRDFQKREYVAKRSQLSFDMGIVLTSGYSSLCFPAGAVLMLCVSPAMAGIRSAEGTQCFD